MDLTCLFGTTEAENWQASKTTIQDTFQFLLNNERLADVYFIVGDNKQTKIPAHKFILSARSAVFEAMFFGSLASTSSEINLPDIEPSIFLEFLKFLYTDKVKINPQTVTSTLYIAKKYHVPPLEIHCVEFLRKSCNSENVILILTQARLFDEQELIKVCFNVIDQNARSVLASKDFENISFEILTEVIERDTLEIDEIALFKAAVKWSKAECLRKNLPVTPDNQRSVLSNVFTLIRFPIMNIDEFVTGPVKSGLLTDREVVQLVLCLKGGDPKPDVPFLNKNRQRNNKQTYFKKKHNKQTYNPYNPYNRHGDPYEDY